MKLTNEQLTEIINYLLTGPRYQETFNEIYDHVLNALADIEGEYSIERVHQIIEEDFKSFSEIKRQEEIYRQQCNRNYTRLLGREMLNTFRFPEVLSNLILVLMYVAWYKSAVYGDLIKDIMYPSLYVIATIPLIYYLVKRYIIDRHFVKMSIKYDFLHRAWAIVLLGVYISAYLFVSKHSPLALSAEARYQCVFVVFFMMSIFIRAYTRFYNKKIRVITA